MVFDPCHQRGKVDRSWKLSKMSFHRNSSYDAMKKRCMEATWPGHDQETFYIADGSGVSIEKESFGIVTEDGNKNYIAWTLANYLQISLIKYPSRARLYCVKLCKGKRVVVGC